MLPQIYILVTVLNIVLLIILAVIFARSYIKLRSPFNLGLLIFAIILLFQALLACPLSYLPYGIYSCGNLPFSALAAIFEFIALSLLLYLVTR